MDKKNEKSKEHNSDRDKYIRALIKGESEKSASARAGFKEPITAEELITRDATIIPPLEEEIPDELLTTITKRKCPKHSCNLYDTRYDGLWYYCPKCKKQYHTKWIL